MHGHCVSQNNSVRTPLQSEISRFSHRDPTASTQIRIIDLTLYYSIKNNQTRTASVSAFIVSICAYSELFVYGLAAYCHSNCSYCFHLCLLRAVCVRFRRILADANHDGNYETQTPPLFELLTRLGCVCTVPRTVRPNHSAHGAEFNSQQLEYLTTNACSYLQVLVGVVVAVNVVVAVCGVCSEWCCC